MKAVRSLLDDPRVFDAVVVLLATWFLLSAYVVAWAYVIRPQGALQVASAGLVAVSASWFALTGFLFFAFGRGLGHGLPWNRALPDGYIGTLTAALVFGAAWIADTSLWVPFFGRSQLGLEALFTPPHLVEVAAAAVMVSGPLRAAARRGETTASAVTLLSVALLLSVLTFATQFAHPLIDPWSSQAFQYRVELRTIGLTWVADNLGIASILAQAAILVGTALLLNSAFKLRFGSLTLVFAVNGVFVTITKQGYELLPVAILTGLAGDLWLMWARRWPGRRGASLGAVIAGSYALLSILAVALVGGGTAWDISLSSAVVFGALMLGWLMGRLLPASLPAALVLSPPPLVGEPAEAQWTRDPESTVRPQLVKSALDDLGTPERLGRSPLALLPGVSRGGSAASDLRSLLVDVIGDLATSPSPRDAEAGHLLLDYYVKKFGSHEVIMERLHLSRPTFYRRLQRGFALVAERLDELSEFAQRVPVND
ncbi:MAG: hypothetical protein M3082_18680 [Candidatus Dormibacteraeota bacterium]|nr:hypothetical protein [Candidatus Dormibacteraeota bacterium]